mgnify:CR=1 FL=1
MAEQKLNFKELEAERDKLYVSKNNPKRLKEIIELLDYIYFGIKM